MIHKQGFPPLGRRCFAGSSSSLNQGKVAEEQLSEFQLRFEQVRGDLPMFKETFQFDLDKCWLWNLYKSGDFAEIWKDEGNIHEYVSNALIYVRRAFEDSLGLVSRLIISKQQLIAKSKPDVVIIASDSLQIIGACEIKVPQKSQYQCNGFESSTRSVSSQFTNVRDALSVWHSNEAVLEGDRDKFDKLCHPSPDSEGEASDLLQSTVFYSRVYRHNENALVSSLGTVLYKLAKSPQNVGLEFLSKRFKYPSMKAAGCNYLMIPANFHLTVAMPGVRVKNVFKFERYCQIGGDSSVFMAADISGRMCVIKSLHPDSEHSLEDEMRMWKLLYPRYDQVCIKVLNNVKHLIMPFVFHARKYQIGDDGKETVIFCPPHAWNRRLRPNEIFFDENIVPELGKLDQNAVNQWRDNPQEAMQYALEKIKQHGYEHQDAEWRNLALFPFPDPYRPGVCMDRRTRLY